MLFREENQYLDIARKIVDEGYIDKSRTGIDIRKSHAEHMSFSLADDRVPVLSTRQVPTKNPIVEMVWFISGSTDIKFLKDNNCHIWDDWVNPLTAVYDADLDVGIRELEKRGLIKFGEGLIGQERRTEFMFKYGPALVNQMLGELTGVKPPERKLLSGSIGEGAYGAQWRAWEDIRAIPFNDEKEFKKLVDMGYSDITWDIIAGAMLQDNPALRIMQKKHDQLQTAIDTIKNNEESRRIIVCPWNPGRLDQAQLPPCHSFYQFLPFESNGQKYLDLSLTCRSQDFLVGTVFNVFQYGVLCQLVAKLTGRKANRLFWTGNNTHIYENQVEIFNDYHRDRSPQSNNIRLEIADGIDNISDFKVSDIKLTGYTEYLEKINYPVAV